jgi:uncharacterized protein YpmS
MASSNRPTAVHFFLILTGMATLGLTVSTIFGFKGRNEERAKAEAAANSESQANATLATTQADLNKAMQLLGTDPTSYQAADEGMRKAMATLGKNQEKPTVLATLEAMRAALDSLEAEVLTAKSTLQTTQQEILTLRQSYQTLVDAANGSKDSSEQLVQKTQAEKDEIVQERDKMITLLKADLQREQIDKEQIREQADKTEKDLSSQIASLANIVNSQRERIEEMLKTSFEVADGTIVSVDPQLKIVSINLGQLDNLKPGVSFSVYSHDHRGIAREARDIKGRIEVTRLLGPHQAEGRILEQDRARPISEGDPIYSPVWAGGRKEYFSFVGVIDFDNDGRSDRDTLHRILKSSGAEIEIEVNDDGVREPADSKVTVNSKFLVLGRIPDPTQYASADERRVKSENMMAQESEMKKEALAAGVRTVKLEDFLAYLGHKPQQRYFVPGQSSRYTLEHGVRTPVKPDDASSGQTSKLYERMKREEDTGIQQFRK